ncbi:MAG: choice-of-anchor D domain-containing protein [Burkholderiales bacterium]
MKRTSRLVIALLAPFVVAWSGSAWSANCSNGKTLYNKTTPGLATACSNSNCHGTNFTKNTNNIYNGAGNPSAIDAALDNVNEMSSANVRGELGLTPGGAGIDDLAEYLMYATAGQNCPAATANVSASPTSASFGSINVGASSSSQTITVSNTGGAASPTLTYPAAPTHFTKAGSCPSSGALAAGANCTLVFTFSPTAAGTFSPTYTITGTGISIGIALSGTGVAATPNLQASSSTAAFGAVQVGQTSGTQQITITNTGGAQATGIALSNPNATEFLVTGNTCGATLNANASCAFSIAYKPAAVGSDNTTLSITSNAPTVNIAMSGNGTAPPSASLSASPATLAFGSVTVGTTSATKSVTVTNNGGATAASVAVANSNAAEFAVSGSNCGTSLAPGASCTFNVAYTPATASADNASLSITYTGGSAVTVFMSGTGTAPATPNVQAAPGSLAFGSITVGTTAAAKAVTISNTGGASATGLGVASSDAVKFPLSGNTCGSTLAAGASCTVSVAYAPAAAAADSGTLTVSFAGGTPISVALSGTGSAAPTPNVTATPAPIAFGNVTVGQTSPGTTVTVANTGSAAATGVAFAGSNAAEFVVSNNTCGATIGAGASCTLAIAYSPSAAGADSATLTITYGGGGAVSIALSGTGVASTPPPGTGQLSLPAAVPFGDQAVGTASATQTITVSNTGSAAVTVSAITSSNSGEFAVSASTCGVVNAGASCSFALAFTPSAAGSRSATVTVASTGAGSPQTIAASGNGVTGGTPPPVGTAALAVEYYHAGFDHYFMTYIQDEITKLDNGTFKGWTRTGKSFKVYPSAAAGLNAVCRFFSTAFGEKSSHFYTPDAPECGVVKSNPSWMFEAEVFHIAYPAFDGSCPAATVPVYRVYNNGQGGAPNHRYTTEMDVRNAMLALGWIAEGAGKIGVIMCAPQ